MRSLCAWRHKYLSLGCIIETKFPSSKETTCTKVHLRETRAFSRVRLHCYAYEDMASYTFKKFFDPAEIENEWDLQLQEKLLKQINWLIDEKIIEIPRKERKKRCK